MRCFGKHPSDGKTPRVRITGNASIPNLAHFGECILFKPAKTVVVGKDEPRWRNGVFLGFLDSTTEYIIGTPLGIIKCRSIRRQDSSEQFCIDALLAIRGTPWHPVPGREGMKLPTNIEESGEIIDDNGEVEAHVEEARNIGERIHIDVDSGRRSSKEDYKGKESSRR